MRDTIFVTGAGGSIGRIVARTLLDRGFRIRGFGLGEQYYSTPDFFRDLARRGDFKFEIGSILDQNALTRAMRGARWVIHLAAMTGRKTEADRLGCFDINVNGTQHVMTACVANRVERVINISSSAVYGQPANNPVGETEPPKPASAYALSKLAAEEVVAAYSQAFAGFHYTTLRLFNAYGEQCTSALALDTFVRQAVEGRSPVINGDGTQRRCYTHAEDIGEAISRILTVPESCNRIYNLGNPDAVITIRDLAKLVFEVIAPHKNLVGEFRSPSSEVSPGVAAIWADIGRLESDTKFRPRIGLREGLERIRDGLRAAGRV